MATKVYILIHADLPVFKVGVADDIATRAKRIGAPVNHAESYSIECTNRKQAYRLEKLIHWALEQHRHTETSQLPQDGATEWFSCSALELAIECIGSPFVSSSVLMVTKGIELTGAAENKEEKRNETKKEDIPLIRETLIQQTKEILDHIETLSSLGMTPSKSSSGSIDWILPPCANLDVEASTLLIAAIENMPKISVSGIATKRRFSSTVYGGNFQYTAEHNIVTHAIAGSFHVNHLLRAAQNVGIANELQDRFQPIVDMSK